MITAADQLAIWLRSSGVKAAKPLWPKQLANDVRLLRDCFEHQAEPNAGPNMRFAKKYPTHKPTDHQWNMERTVLGGVVEVSEHVESAAAVHEELLRFEADS